MVTRLYSHTRIGIEQGFTRLPLYGRPWVTEKPTCPHGVSYHWGPTMFQRSSPRPLELCARTVALKAAARTAAARRFPMENPRTMCIMSNNIRASAWQLTGFPRKAMDLLYAWKAA